MRALIALVACCGLLLWAARVVWENRDPALAEERAFQSRALRALESRQAAERLTAIQDLKRVRLVDGTVAIHPLIAMLGDEDHGARVAAVESLGTLGALAVRTGSDDDAVRAAVKALIGRLQDPSPDMRVASASGLGALAFAKPLSGASLPAGPPPLGGKKAPPKPAPAVKGPVDHVAVSAALTGAIRDREARVRGAALVALASTSTDDPPGALVAGLTDESASNRKATVWALGRFRRGLDPWIPLLLRAAERDNDPSVREAVAGFLSAGVGPPRVSAAVVPALIEGLGSRDPKVAVAVTYALVEFGPEARAAIPTLLRVFTEITSAAGSAPANDRRDLTRAVASTLGRVAPGSASAREVLGTLAEAVRSDRGDRQVQAAWALAPFGPTAEPAVPALIRMVGDTSPSRAAEHDEAAAWALGRIAPGTPAADEAVAALENLLQSSRAPARVAAVEALGRFGPSAAASLPKLLALRKDPDAQVRRAIERVLEVLGGGGEP